MAAVRKLKAQGLLAIGIYVSTFLTTKSASETPSVPRRFSATGGRWK